MFESIIDEIREERLRQDMIFGESDKARSIWELLAVLGEEYGEVCKSVNDMHTYWKKPRVDKSDIDLYTSHIREECVQVAAVAVKILEAIAEYGVQLECQR